MQSFHSKHTKHYIVLTILLLVAGLSAMFLSSNQDILDNHVNETSMVVHEKETSSTEARTTEGAKSNEKDVDNAKFVYNSVDKKAIEESTILENEHESIDNSIQIDSTDNETASETEENTETTELAEVEQNTIPSSFIVEDISYSTQIPRESNVYDLMSKLRTDHGLVFTEKDFGGSLGIFITSINGIENGGSENKYWIFYVNDEKSKLGISNYILKPHDVIEWKYEKNDL